MPFKKKVIVRIRGGLGNQLFMYAAARRLALKNGAELVIDDISGFIYDTHFQRSYQLGSFAISARKATASERFEPFSRLRRKLNRAVSQRLPFERRAYLCQEGPHFDTRLLTRKVAGTLVLEGYWQSQKYFLDVEETIRADLLIKAPIDVQNRHIGSLVCQDNTVAIHVRFFRNEDGQIYQECKPEYYQMAIDAIESRVSNAQYYLFSDFPDEALAKINVSTDKITTVSNNRGDAGAIADLWLMSQCNHFIIGNSTFSWWAAWLASRPSKLVVAPSSVSVPGVSNWTDVHLIPQTWISL